MELVVLFSIVIALFGALAQLALDYPINSHDLIEGDRDRPQPMWFTRSGSIR